MDNNRKIDVYTKKDDTMTKGMAIICMLTLHLFCRVGDDVFGIPLFWIDRTTPFVFLLGFFAEICVPIYSFCAGYALKLQMDNKSLSWRRNLIRVWRLLSNYWIVLFLFCGIGYITGVDPSIPGNGRTLLKSIVLLHSYNGAWWFLNTYILLMIIPPCIILFPVKWMSVRAGMLFCFAMEMGIYLVNRLGTIGGFEAFWLVEFIQKEIHNLIGILPYIWIGAFLCKGQILNKCNSWVERNITHRNFVLGFVWILLFISNNLIHKSVLVGITALSSFIIFNLMKKAEKVEDVFLFLGRHSTNIWLVHMFFYAYLFKGLVVRAKYPVFMFVLLLFLSIISSYIIMGIQYIIKCSIFCKCFKRRCIGNTVEM